MAVMSLSREASKDEMGREIDRRGAVIDALTEERDRLKQWQADQVEVNEEAKALITELNADKKALEAERDRLKDQRDYYKARDEEGERIQAEIEAERDRLAKANAELLEGLEQLKDRKPFFHYVLGPDLSQPGSPFDRGKQEAYREFKTLIEALLAKHKATSTEREGK